MREHVSDNVIFNRAPPSGEWLTVIENIVPITVDEFDGPIPEAFRSALFVPISQNDDRKIRTYAVLDAGVIFGLVETLQASDIPYQFLYSGAGGEELRDVGPWLVELHEHHPLTRSLLTAGDAPSHHWRKKPGLFFRSYLPIADVARHLRHFTRVRTEGDRWALFRFWEPEIATVYFGTMPERPELFARWCYDFKQRVVEQWVMLYCDPPWTLDAPSWSAPRDKVIRIVEDEDRTRFSFIAWRLAVLEIAKSVKQPDWSKAPPIQVERTTAIVAKWAENYGISGKRDLGRLVNVALRLGCWFDRDPRFSQWVRAALGNESAPANVRVLAVQNKAAEYLRGGIPFDERLQQVELILSNFIEEQPIGPKEACRMVDHALADCDWQQFCDSVISQAVVIPKLSRWPAAVLCAIACLLGASFMSDPSRSEWLTAIIDAADLPELLEKFRLLATEGKK